MTGTPARLLVGLLFVPVGCARPPRTIPDPPVVIQGADSSHTDRVADGVTYTRTWDARGPWAIHVLQIDLDQCRPSLRAAKAGPSIVARATVSELGANALAAVNADFFELPGGRPVGAHVSGGQLLIGPGERPVLAMTSAGLVQGRARIEGWAAAGSDTVRVQQVNRRTDGEEVGTGALLVTGSAGLESIPAVRLRRIEGDVRQGRGVVMDEGKVSAGMGPDEVGIENVSGWAARRAVGDTVAWTVELVVEGGSGSVLEVVGGFPTLLRDGRSVLAGQAGIRPDFGDRRHPRTAVGWNARSVFLVVVDGRQPPWSDGMSLPELAVLLRGLGAREGINLDGGGSSAMAVRGRTVNRPSDAQGERAVGNALLLERCS